MRLECEVVMLKESMKSSGVPVGRRPTKSSKAILSLGKNHEKGGFRYLLHIATRAAPKGPQIEVTPGNVRSIHKERVSAGSMSLIFVDPPLTLIVMKSIPVHLQRFLEKFLAILKGGEISLKSLDKVRQSDFKAALKSLKVTSDTVRSISYPASLETLEVTALDLQSVDSRWFSLPLLTTLDLSYNRLGQATNFVKIKLISRLNNLRVFSLERNEISALPPFFFDLLPPSLLVLNLSNNLLVSLPDSIVKARNLRNLNLSHNLLTSLPRDISDMQLRCLFLDHNRLPCLPYDLKTRRFEKLYFDYNPMIAAIPGIRGSSFPSLCSLALTTVRSYSLPEVILPWDLKMIGNELSMKCSCCRKWTPSSLLSLSFVRVMATDFAMETDMMQSITMRAFTCQKCVYYVNGRRR